MVDADETSCYSMVKASYCYKKCRALVKRDQTTIDNILLKTIYLSNLTSELQGFL